ncbi:MAG: penicillin-binding transpeptidase domain-containing protein [Candidatus Merdivicinus sp.]|jgi:penicillin-binding protein 2
MSSPKPQKPKERVRLIILSFLAAFVCGAYILQLMNFQIVRGEEFLSKTQQMTVSKIAVKAGRGEITDCEGVPLAENKVGYNIVFYYSFLPSGEDRNRIIAELIEMLEAAGEDWYDPLPLTMEENPQFLENRESDIELLKDKLEVNVYATAEDCMYNLRSERFFDIGEEYDDLMARKIAGVRYGMVLADFSVNNNQYTFAEDVTTDTVMKVKELSYQFPGVDIVDEDIRVYPDGDLAPHIIGVVGQMYAEQYYGDQEKGIVGYKEKGYPMNALIGRFGIEQYMEDTLHGVDGVKTVEQSKDGTIMSETITQAPESGNNVGLTIHAEFQAEVQNILNQYLEYLRSLPDDPKGADNGNQVIGGSVVVLDAKTGAVKAAVTAPTYDLNNYFSDYNELAAREDSPMLNRAFDGLYRPGSTFKTVIAAGALNEGIITPNDTVNCQRVYTYYDYIPGNTFRPTCLGYHGNTDVVKALTVSCNIFFYDVGRRLGIDKIQEYAHFFGLGTDTGLELTTAVGGISGPDRSEKLGTVWQPGNVCQTSIGQMDTAVTPLQLATQAMTLANQGTRYRTYLIQEVRSYDDAEVLETTEPEIMSEFSMSDSAYTAICAGMIGAAESVAEKQGTLGWKTNLTDLPYQVALKTGTPQVTNTTFSSSAIAFAPVEDPEIAIGILLERGADAKYLVRPILDAYTRIVKGESVTVEE